MSIKVISYDLRKPGRDYEGLYKEIRALGSYTHPMDSVWFVDSGKTTSGILEALAQHLDANDRILVHTWPQYKQMRLSQSTLDWIKKHE